MVGVAVPIALGATDTDGDPLMLRIVSQPSHGTAGLDGTRATYFPDPEFAGSDSFTFAAWDGSTDSNLGTVSITVSGVPATATTTPALPTATIPPSPTHTPGTNTSPCVGDCNADGAVTVDELVTGVNIALDILPLTRCTALDANTDGQITVNELVIAVNATLNGCPIQITPTATPASTALATNSPLPTATPETTNAPGATPTGTAVASLAVIQANIFNPTCTDLFCHSGAVPAGGLALTDGMSHDQLVGVSSSNPVAQQAGLLRIKAGDPDNSFLIIKLTGPSPAEGSPMPLGKSALAPAQLQLIRDWITAGAPP